MLADIVAGTRAIRIQLTIGYSILASIYLAVDSETRNPSKWSGTWRLLADLYDDLGSAGRPALWAVVATVLGSVVFNVGLDRFLDWVVDYRFDWATFIGAAHNSVKRYEEYEVSFPALVLQERLGVGAGSSKHRVPSATWGGYLDEHAGDRIRKREEVRFRLAFALATVPPVVVLACRGGLGWFLGLLPAVLVFGDAWLIQQRTARSVIDARIQGHNAQRIQAVQTESQHATRLAAFEAGEFPPNTVEASKPEAIDNLRKEHTAAVARLNQIDQMIASLTKLRKHPLPALDRDFLSRT